jgi:hypothetical protein
VCVCPHVCHQPSRRAGRWWLAITQAVTLLLQPGMGMRLTTYYRCVFEMLRVCHHSSRHAGRWWQAVTQVVTLLMLMMEPGMRMRLTTLHRFAVCVPNSARSEFYPRVPTTHLGCAAAAAAAVCRRKNDSDMYYQALQAEYTEGLLARQVSGLRP